MVIQGERDEARRPTVYRWTWLVLLNIYCGLNNFSLNLGRDKINVDFGATPE